MVLSYQTQHQYEEDENRKHELQVGFHPAAKLDSGTGVDLLNVVVKSPAEAGHTEQQIDQ